MAICDAYPIGLLITCGNEQLIPGTTGETHCSCPRIGRGNGVSILTDVVFVFVSTPVRVSWKMASDRYLSRKFFRHHNRRLGPSRRVTSCRVIHRLSCTMRPVSPICLAHVDRCRKRNPKRLRHASSFSFNWLCSKP